MSSKSKNLTRLYLPHEVVLILMEDQDEIKSVIAERKVSPEAIGAIYMAFWETHKEDLKEYILGLLLEAHDPVIRVLETVSPEISKDTYRQAFLNFEDCNDDQYLRRIQGYYAHIPGFAVWALENDLISKCLKHLSDGTNSAFHILEKFHIPIKGMDLTDTARILLRHEAWRLYLSYGPR